MSNQAGGTTYTVTAPTMGGVVKRSFDIAWTGGIPKADWSGLAKTATRPKTPLCYRHEDPGKEAKVYARITTPPEGVPKIGRQTSAANILHIVTKSNEHAENTGIDTIFCVRHPTIPDKMVSVITHYLSLTIEHVKSEIKRVETSWDTYDEDNNAMAQALVRAMLDETTTREIAARDPEGEMPAALIWMYAMDNRAGLSSDQIEKIQAQMKEWTPLKVPGQNVKKYATKIRELKIELDKVNGFTHSITKKVLLNLSHCTPPRFNTEVFAKMKGIETEIVSVKTMSYKDAEAHMVSKGFDIESILTEFERLYKDMFDSNEWVPARNKTDKATPEVNQFDFKTMSEAEFCQFVEKKIAERNQSPGSKSESEEPKEKKKWKKGLCMTCGQEGHKQSDCPNANAPTVETLPEVNDAAPDVVKINDKYKFKCLTCKRYTMTHVTSQHKAPANAMRNNSRRRNNNNSPGQTEANVAAVDGVAPWAPWA